MHSLLYHLKSKLNRSQNGERIENSRSVLFFLLGMLLIATPLLVDVRGYITFEPVKVLFVLGVAAMMLPFCWLRAAPILREMVGRVRQGRNGSGVTRRVLVAGLILGVYVVSLILSWRFSIAPEVSFWGLEPRYHGLLLHGALIVLLVATVALDRRLIGRLLEVVMIGSVMVSLYGILQRFFPALSQWWSVGGFLGRIFSTLGHPNYLADYLVLVLPLFFWKYLVSRRWYVWLILGMFPFLALLWTLSRSGLLGLLSSFIFFGIVYSRWGSRQKLFYGFLLIPVMFALVIGGVNFAAQKGWLGGVSDGSGANGQQTQNVLSRLVVSGESARSIESRLIIWPATWKRILERPIFGYGLDTYSMAFAPVTPRELLVAENLNSYADRAHNIFLDRIMESGVVGVLAWILCIAGSLFLAYKSGDLSALAMASALIGHTVSQQFGFQTVSHMVLMWFFVGGIWVVTRELNSPLRDKDSVAERGEIRGRWSIFVGVIFLVGVILSGVFLSRFVYQTWRADRLARVGEYHQAYELAPHRIRYGLEASRYDYDEASLTILDQIESFTNAVSHLPFWYRAKTYSQAYEFEQAYVNFEHARALSPMSLQMYLDYGYLLMEAGESSRAVTLLEQYVALAPDYWKKHEAYKAKQLSAWDRKRYEVFYKMYPDFDEVFDLISRAKSEANEALQRTK